MPRLNRWGSPFSKASAGTRRSDVTRTINYGFHEEGNDLRFGDAERVGGRARHGGGGWWWWRNESGKPTEERRGKTVASKFLRARAEEEEENLVREPRRRFVRHDDPRLKRVRYAPIASVILACGGSSPRCASPGCRCASGCGEKSTFRGRYSGEEERRWANAHCARGGGRECMMIATVTSTRPGRDKTRKEPSLQLFAPS